MSRETVLARLRAAAEAGEPLIGAAVGTGLSARAVEKGGVDLVAVHSSGRFSMAGRGSLAGMLPYGDANAIVMDLVAQILPVVRRVPLLAGVCGTDPFRSMGPFLAALAATGVVGVQNFPTVGLYDGRFRQHLEDTGMGFALEVEMIREARRHGLLAAPFAFDPEQAAALAGAGADVLVAHVGLTTGGAVGATTAVSLQEAARAVQFMHDAAVAVTPEILVLCHGGPIAEPADVRYVFTHTTGIAGFFGASAVERLPAERAIAAQATQFKHLAL